MYLFTLNLRVKNQSLNKFNYLLLTFKIKNMDCPICKVTLLMAEKQGVEIDYCPTCRGVWLDRGEIEKIIERSYDTNNNLIQPNNEGGQFFNRPDDSHNYHDSSKHDSHGYKYGRKRNLLSELFD
jgi:uncharacterized protein